jgi:hypothetical protein
VYFFSSFSFDKSEKTTQEEISFRDIMLIFQMILCFILFRVQREGIDHEKDDETRDHLFDSESGDSNLL